MHLIGFGFAPWAVMHFSLQADLQNHFFRSFLRPFKLGIFQFQQFCCILFPRQMIRLLCVFSSMTFHQFANHWSFFFDSSPSLYDRAEKILQT